ncbi:hypothetical protein OIO90_006626 [Microbotryomycetes sp. JL221]|nr:hypothetical protein OIO90_006626 [Microbotryomycetes sp. JL221]
MLEPTAGPALSPKQQLINLAQQMEALVQQNQELHQQLAAISQTLQPIVQVHKESLPISKPATFDGKDKNKYSSFISQCKLYILAVPHQFKNDAVKVSFVLSLLRDKAYRAFEPCYKTLCYLHNASPALHKLHKTDKPVTRTGGSDYMKKPKGQAH